MAIKRNAKVNPNLSTASMTDLIFLLLIFFVVASTSVNNNALRLLLPKSNSKTTSKPMTSVSIKQTGQNNFEYYVRSKRVQHDLIERELNLMLSGAEDPIITLYTDKTVPIEEVVSIMNIAQRNRYRLILATTPE